MICKQFKSLNFIQETIIVKMNFMKANEDKRVENILVLVLGIINLETLCVCYWSSLLLWW